MMRTIRAPESKQATTLLVAVRCRPVTSKEKEKSRDILRVVDDKVVVVLDPDTSKEYLDRVQGRSKEKKYAFDFAFGANSSNKDVYRITVAGMVEGVVEGLNATVFAYGATGSGKTHTMAGTPDDPGLMVLSLQAIFKLIAKEEAEHDFDVTCSYLEVYNEVIYDLLESNSHQHLELRDSPDQGITVFGLKRIKVSSAEKILELLNQGNARRKTESTDANATSSRSHAVLEIIVRRKQRNSYRAQVLQGKLALVDLAGSERASETNNAGQKLRDGANINRSLLALANCINALGKQQKKGLAYVPYRNSKLTRLLKDGLSGNSRTVMVATVSSGDDQYQQTINTLKYADRAKEIKTHIQTNIGTVDAHVADYQKMIDNLQVEVSELRRELAEKETQLSARTSDKTADDELSWLDVLSHDINENVEERINLQKALFELEDTNLHNRAELQRLDELIAEGKSLSKEMVKCEDLRDRRQVVLDNIRDNEEAGSHIRQDIEQNEAQRKQLQRMIDEAISSDRNKTFLRILSQYRLLGMSNMELQIQIAVRDQIIHDHQENLKNLWSVLKCSGLNQQQIMKIASLQGIVIEERIMPPSSGLVPISTTSTTYKQPSGTNSGPLTTTGQRCPNSDVSVTKVSKTWTNTATFVRGENELLPAASPSLSSGDTWKNVRVVDNSRSTMQVTNNLDRVANSRTKIQKRTGEGDEMNPTKWTMSRNGFHHNAGCYSPENSNGMKIAGGNGCGHPVRERADSGRQEQCSFCPPVVSEERSTVWQKSSVDNHARQYIGGVRWDEDGPVGMDISDSSDTEGDNITREGRNGRRLGQANALANDMLRQELSRLDSELQDLKRGMDGRPLSQWGSNVRRTINVSETDVADSRRLSAPLYCVSKGLLAVNYHGHLGVQNKGGKNGTPYSGGTTGAWERRSSWRRRDSLDSALNLGIGPRISAFGSARLLEDHAGMIPNVNMIIDQHKSKVVSTSVVTRQMWPTHVSGWK